MKKITELTNQEGDELVSKSNRTKKTRVKKKTYFPRIVSQTFDKPIFNQSPLIQKYFVNVLFQKDIFFNL